MMLFKSLHHDFFMHADLFGLHVGVFFAFKSCSSIRVKYSRLSTKEMYSQDGIRYYSVRADEKSNFSNCTSR